MKTTRTPAAAENEKWLRVSFSQIFYSGLEPDPKKNPGSRRSRLWHSGSVTTSGVDPSGILTNWVIGFVFSITARSASALAVAFFRLLDPLSYVRFDILKLTQVSLL